MVDTLTLPRDAVRAARAWRRQVLRWLPLTVILAAQAAYTIRLIPIGYPSTDEARYIEAGHILIHELFHGGGTPYYETYFSGSPDIYPPLAAIADYIGSVVAVRLMSTCFMLAATFLLFATSERLVGYAAAVCSAGLFAGLGMTQVVGRNTIYDAMAYAIVAAAAYCAARSRDGEVVGLLLIPPVLFAAYFTKYVTLLFDPVVIGMASLGIGPWRAVLRRIAVLGATTGALIVLGVFLAGTAYLKGMRFTLFNRQPGADNLLAAGPADPRVILTTSWGWFGAVLLLAFAGTAAALFMPRHRQHFALMLLCAVAGTLVTVEALHLGTLDSAQRHDDLGMWFASIPAGYLAAAPLTIVKHIAWKSAAACAAAIAVLFVWQHYGQLPSTFPQQTGYDTGNGPTPVGFYAALRPYLLIHDGKFLLSGLDNFAIVMNDRVSLPWYAYETDDNYIKYPIPGRGGDWTWQVAGRSCLVLKPDCTYLEGAAGFRLAIKNHAFDLITLDRSPSQSLPTDPAIRSAVESTPGYVLVYRRGSDLAWIYLPDYQHKDSGR